MRYQVDSEQMNAASGAVAASVTTVRTEVAAMMRNLDALQGTWRAEPPPRSPAP